jgi:hypothetical protein
MNGQSDFFKRQRARGVLHPTDSDRGAGGWQVAVIHLNMQGRHDKSRVKRLPVLWRKFDAEIHAIEGRASGR